MLHHPLTTCVACSPQILLLLALQKREGGRREREQSVRSEGWLVWTLIGANTRKATVRAGWVGCLQQGSHNWADGERKEGRRKTDGGDTQPAPAPHHANEHVADASAQESPRMRLPSLSRRRRQNVPPCPSYTPKNAESGSPVKHSSAAWASSMVMRHPCIADTAK